MCPFSHFLTQHASFWRLYHPTRAPNIRITFSSSHFCSPFSSTCNHFHSFFEKMLPASVGITFLQVNPVHFDSKNPPSGPPGGGKTTDVGNCFTPSASFWRLFQPTKAPNVHITSSSSHFFPLFSSTCNLFHSFFEKMLPALCGDHMFANQSGAFDSKSPFSGSPGGGKNTDVGNCFAPSASF